MRHVVREAGLESDFVLDSAGISNYHQGEPSDPRMRLHAARRGYEITHLSRPVTYQDFFDFDMIIGMDESNLDALHDRAPGIEEERKLYRMTDFCRNHPDVDHVPDPYYGGDQGFERVLDLLEDGCAGLLEYLQR